MVAAIQPDHECQPSLFREDQARMAKLVYKPLSLVFSVFGGIIASAIFKRAWRVFAHESEAPKATEAGKGWIEVLSAAAGQGAVFGAVKALIDRAGATGFARLTGVWPGPGES
jgi:hypothetical protein